MNHADDLEPLDDVMGRLTGNTARPTRSANISARSRATGSPCRPVPARRSRGPCGRICILKDAAGLDMVKMFPAQAPAPPGCRRLDLGCDAQGRRGLREGGKPFGIGLGTTPDSVDTAGALFAAFGAELVNAKGDITVKSDAVRQVLEYAQRLVKLLPKDAVSYDDASNNRALISGQSALIWNPPSAWAVAKRDAPAVAEDCWTFPAPSGPEGALHAVPAVSSGASGSSARTSRRPRT